MNSLNLELDDEEFVAVELLKPHAPVRPEPVAQSRDAAFVRFVATCEDHELWNADLSRYDVEFADELGNTALHVAALSRSAFKVSHLLRHGWDINAQNAELKTPAMIICWCYNSAPEDFRKILAKSGARLDIYDKNNLNLVDYVLHYKCLDFLERVLVQSTRRPRKNLVKELYEPLGLAEYQKSSIKNVEIVSDLGAGASSRVHGVRMHKKDFALKVFNQPALPLREYILPRLVESPFVVKSHNAWTEKTKAYLVTDLCHFGSLREILNIARKSRENQLKLDPGDVLVLMAELVHFLEAMRAKGIVHRDLKPENIFVDYEGHIKVGDFGGSGFSIETESKNIYFTRPYAPPEVQNGSDYSNLGIDLYSLGLILYELLNLAENPEKSCDLRDSKAGQSLTPLQDALANDLIIRLTAYDPRSRIGFKDFEELKQHPYFSKRSMDWSVIASRSVPAFSKTKLDGFYQFLRKNQAAQPKKGK